MALLLIKQRKEQFLLCPLIFKLPVVEAVVRRRMLMILLNPRRNPFIPAFFCFQTSLKAEKCGQTTVYSIQFSKQLEL